MLLSVKERGFSPAFRPIPNELSSRASATEAVPRDGRTERESRDLLFRGSSNNPWRRGMPRLRFVGRASGKPYFAVNFVMSCE